MANTVSRDVAKRLKAAGCIWKPRPYDCFAYENGKKGIVDSKEYLFVVDYPERFTWLPGLSDILSRLEELGYAPDSIRNLKISAKDKNYSCGLWKHPSKHEWWLERNFDADTREDSAGLALIWALEQEGEKT